MGGGVPDGRAINPQLCTDYREPGIITVSLAVKFFWIREARLWFGYLFGGGFGGYFGYQIKFLAEVKDFVSKRLGFGTKLGNVTVKLLLELGLNIGHGFFKYSGGGSHCKEKNKKGTRTWIWTWTWTWAWTWAWAWTYVRGLFPA